jgi:hypothetical protein
MKNSQTNYRKSLWRRYTVCLVGLIVLWLSQAHAKPVTKQIEGQKIKFTAAKKSTDATNVYVYLTKGNGDPLLALNAAITAECNGAKFDVKSGFYILTGTVPDQAELKLTVRGKTGYTGAIRLGSIAFRDANNKVIGEGAAVGGGMKGDPIYTLYNDLIPSANLSVQNLVFYENHSPVDFCTLDPAVPIDSNGIPEAGAFLNGPGSSQDYSVPPPVDGTFFIAQGEVFAVGSSFSSGLVCRRLHNHCAGRTGSE